MSEATDQLVDLFVQINGMIVEGSRKPEEVLRFIRRVVDDPDYIRLLDVVVSKPNDMLRQARLDSPSVDERLAEQLRFYQEVFGLAVDVSDIEIPAEQPGFGWLLVVPQGMTLNQAWAKCQERFPSQSYLGDNLDKAVPTNDRTPTSSYAKLFRDRVEVDEENKDLSANELAERKVQSITLLERILLELWYHWKTGEHLDVVNTTLCAGSRSSDGYVPYVFYWGEGEFGVGCRHPGDADGYLRSRSAAG